MQYNYDFEIASFLLMAIILVHFVCIRQFPEEKTKVYGRLLITCTAECCANILSCIGLANAALVPQIANEVLAFAFFALEGLASYLIFRYVMTVCEFQGRSKRVVWFLGGVPFLLFSLLVLLTPWIGFFYYFEDGVYYQGFGAGMGYAYIAYYFLLDILLIIRKHRVVNLRTKMIMTLYTAAAIGMIVIQYHVRGLLLTSVGNAIILLTLYMAMQNPNEMLDDVSGVGNESAFLSQLKNILNRRRDVTILTIHLTKFHHIHTVLGMENSNELLHEVGNYLYRLCGKFHVFRTAGDTFTVLVDTPEEYKGVEETIRERFGRDWIVRNNHVVIPVNMVVQRYPKDFDTIPEFMGMCQFLIECAGEAGNRAVIETDEALLEKYRRRLKVEMAVLKAIQEKSFEVYYQPLYSIKEKRIVSLEALVRLKDEELGFISPDEFIPLAERDGNIIHIGEQVLEECCKFLARHALSNESLGIRTVHVNISMAQCLRKNLTETIVPVLERYHIPPSMITLEITERTAISTPERMQKHMRELGEMGISFAMDDYGSGNSNCSYLIRFPFQEVKMDKDIVWASFENESARIVLENEIRTIKQLGISLVVEGIENEKQSKAMEQLGVDYIQGYYYGKPLPEKECLRYIRNFNSGLEDAF